MLNCKYCNSANTNAQITKKDKKPLVIKSFLLTFAIVWLLTIAVCMIFDSALLAMGIYGGCLIALPVSIVAVVICLAKRNKDVVVFVCNDCGKRTQVK